ncbi:hypothetical protein BAE44_0022009 [Dichanthelium oligosanthes]|uniref:F-box domain-containing protein n=1 Tax=Dichanthelium oligosanthes TaxID=888268 RepID=A0A1E5UVK8_9POAL|nr:hypothetical protein BAE44_0022009 [Dichanthelium oligosanthes]
MLHYGAYFLVAIVSDITPLPFLLQDILHDIISRLPIKEAARTSILSKHWKDVWCSRRNLEFSFKSLCYNKNGGTPYSLIKAQVFIERVNTVLNQHSGIGVEKLEVEFSKLHNEHAEHIDRWLKFAIASKTKQLILDFTFAKEPYSFPLQLFDATTGSHLQSMKLGSVSLKQPSNIKVLLNLTKLELVDVNITSEELEIMLFNCNVLEFLGISRCQMLTSLRTRHPLNHLNHLHVSHCPSLQELELSFGLITLEYEGPFMPLASNSTLRNLCVKSPDVCSALAYIFTELPSTLSHLETLTIGCQEIERADMLDKRLKFAYLRHLRLELNFVSLATRTTDVLDLACLLEAAPYMEKLELHVAIILPSSLHLLVSVECFGVDCSGVKLDVLKSLVMWMDCNVLRYRKRHGELRSRPSQPHSHLKVVNMTGFYGQKDQVELALHILGNASVMETMKINPKPMVAAIFVHLTSKDGFCFVDGYRAAKKYLVTADHRGVVDVVKVRRRDVENVWPYKLVDPIWLALEAERDR